MTGSKATATIAAMTREGALPAAAEGQPLWPRLAPWIAAGSWLLTGALLAASLVIASGVEDAARVSAASTPLDLGAAVFVAMTYATTAVVLATRRPYHVIGWILAGIGLVAALSNLLWALALSGLSEPGAREVGETAAWLDPLVAVPAWTFLGVALMLLFPDGRALSPRWNRLLLVCAVTCILAAIGFAWSPGRLAFHASVENPFALPGPGGSVASALRMASLAILAIVVVAAASSVVLRYRAGTETLRQQVKWFLLAALLFSVAGICFMVLGGALLASRSGAATLIWVSFCLAAAFLPVAVAIAILRHGLYDIDQILSRAFVFGALTAILAGIYTASVRLFNAIFVAVTGEESDAALVLTTLVLATTFTPIKKRLEDLVERRFKEPEEEAAVTPAEPSLTRADVEEIVRRVVREESTVRGRKAPGRRRPGSGRRGAPPTADRA